jgi:hypothetical protein
MAKKYTCRAVELQFAWRFSALHLVPGEAIFSVLKPIGLVERKRAGSGRRPWCLATAGWGVGASIRRVPL